MVNAAGRTCRCSHLRRRLAGALAPTHNEPALCTTTATVWVRSSALLYHTLLYLFRQRCSHETPEPSDLLLDDYRHGHHHASHDAWRPVEHGGMLRNSSKSNAILLQQLHPCSPYTPQQLLLYASERRLRREAGRSPSDAHGRREGPDDECTRTGGSPAPCICSHSPYSCTCARCPRPLPKAK